jgi:hypothetical protein
VVCYLSGLSLTVLGGCEGIGTGIYLPLAIVFEQMNGVEQSKIE